MTQLRRAVFRDMGPFRGEVEIDFTALPLITAITGVNGEGKTFALETSFFGSQRRRMPTQGTLNGRALSRDSMVDVELVTDRPLRFRHLIDGVSGEAKASVFDAHGAALLQTDKVSEFDAWAKANLPDPTLQLASVFGAQGGKSGLEKSARLGGFVDATDGERRTLILRAKGADKYAAMAERARKHQGTTQAKLDTVKARIADEVDRATPLETAKAALTDAENAEHSALVRVKRLRAELDSLEERHREAVEAEAAYKQSVEKRADIALRLDVARQRQEQLVERLAESRADFEANADAATQRERAEATLATIEEHARLTVELKEAEELLVDTDERLANNRMVLDQAEEIRAAAEAVKQGDKDIANLQRELSEADTQLQLAEQDLATRRAGHGETLQRATSAKARRDRLAAKFDQLTIDIAKAKAELPEREAELASNVELIEQLTQKSNELQEQRVAGADERIFGLRVGLQRIADMGPTADTGTAPAIAVGSLEADDAATHTAETLPAELRDVANKLREAQAKHVGLSAAVRRLNAEAETDTAELDTELGAAWEEFNALEAALDLARAGVDESAERVELCRKTRQSSVEKLEAAKQATEPHRKLAERLLALGRAEARLAELEPLRHAAANKAQHARASIATLPKFDTSLGVTGAREAVERCRRLERLATQAEARIAELEPQLATTRSDVSALELALEECSEVAEPPKLPDPAIARAEVETAEQAHRQAASALTLAQAKQAEASQSAERIDALAVEREELEADLADWTRLAIDLGPKALPAAIVDEACPEITTLVNDLLHSCHGPRFTGTIDTQELGADGKKLLETCRYNVIDSEKGTEGDARQHSGGEKAILNEAISLVLTILACRHAGFKAPSLVRDETGAALDAKNARVYIEMLRRAAQQINARHVLFVSHDEQLWALADARLEVGGGTVRVALGAELEAA